jgi:hypothetical protein
MGVDFAGALEVFGVSQVLEQDLHPARMDIHLARQPRYADIDAGTAGAGMPGEEGLREAGRGFGVIRGEDNLEQAETHSNLHSG